MNTFFIIIKKFGNDYFLGAFKNKTEIKNMLLMADTFANKQNFIAWYNNRNEIYDFIIEKCNQIGIDSHKIILGIYDDYSEEVYNNFEDLDEYIMEFAEGYFS